MAGGSSVAKPRTLAPFGSLKQPPHRRQQAVGHTSLGFGGALDGGGWGRWWLQLLGADDGGGQHASFMQVLHIPAAIVAWTFTMPPHPIFGLTGTNRRLWSPDSFPADTRQPMAGATTYRRYRCLERAHSLHRTMGRLFRLTPSPRAASCIASLDKHVSNTCSHP